MRTLDPIDTISAGKREPDPNVQPAKVARRRIGERGSAILEAGLLLPVLVLMTCGAMDFARVFFAGIVVESAARAGVQAASWSVGKAGATVDSDTAAQNDASGQGLTGVTVSSRTFCACISGSAEVACNTSCSGAVPSGYVETTASYTFNSIIPYPGIPQNLVLSSTAKFRAQ
jgi:Flp pilus assembly protein TadG